MKNPVALLTSLAVFCALTSVHASDWPNWLGPNGDNIAPAAGEFEPDLSKWKIVWQKELGKGYSSVTIGSLRAYTMGHDGAGNETVYCLDSETGAEIWKHTYPAKLLPHLHTGGPNATPTLVRGLANDAFEKVITLSKDGQVFCLTPEKGEVLWKANLLEIFGIKLPQWGFASSAVIDANHVIFCGGKTTALDLETGKPAWISQTAYLPAGYATAPVFGIERRKFDRASTGKDGQPVTLHVEMDAAKFVAALDGKGFCILAAADGAEIARHPFKALFDMNATTPAILDNGKRIFIANTVQADMLAFDGHTLKPSWSTKDLRNVMNNSVIESGAIFGISGEQEQASNKLVCLDEATGTEKWSQPNIGYGTLIGIGKTLLILTERGDLITAKADPAAFTELSRRTVLEKVCWTTPTYANGKIYLRNDQGHLVVLGR